MAVLPHFPGTGQRTGMGWRHAAAPMSGAPRSLPAWREDLTRRLAPGFCGSAAPGVF